MKSLMIDGRNPGPSRRTRNRPKTRGPSTGRPSRSRAQVVSSLAACGRRSSGPERKSNEQSPMKLILFANTDWYLYNFRRSLALGARDAGHDVLLVSPAGPHGQRLLELGLRWIPAPMERRSLNPVRELALLLWLTRLVRAEKAD